MFNESGLMLEIRHNPLDSNQHVNVSWASRDWYLAPIGL